MYCNFNLTFLERQRPVQVQKQMPHVYVISLGGIVHSPGIAVLLTFSCLHPDFLTQCLSTSVRALGEGVWMETRERE